MQTRAEIENEADSHIALGLLLRKDRPEPGKSAVHRILSHPLSVSQKIEAIRRIDSKPDAADVLRIVRGASAQAARNHASRISRAIKQAIPRRSSLRFLFTDFYSVQRFGRQSYVLDVRILPPGIRANPHLSEFLDTKIRALAKELSACLAPVAANGWLHLSPLQYNLLVLLKRLADRVAAFDFSHVSVRQRRPIDRLRRIESLFLMLHYDPQTVPGLFDALRSYFETQLEPEKKKEQAFGLILQLLAEDCTVPSLSNCILGLNMITYRRMLSLKDLMRPGLGQIVDVIRFDLDYTIRTRVEGRIDDALESVKLLHAQLVDARRTVSYLAVDTHGRPDMAALKDVYEAASGRYSFNFAADQENVVLFVSRLLQSFDKSFSPLLNGPLVVEGDGRVAIFSPVFFALDFLKLRSLAENLVQQLFRYSRFPLSRYLQIKEGRLMTIGHEMEVSQLIRQSVVCLADLGRTVMKVLSLRAPAREEVHSREALESVILHGKSFVIPYENSRIRSRSILNGVTVGQALAEVTTVCFSAGVLLHDDFVSMYVSKERRLETELRRQMRFLENLLDPESYQELAKAYL
jgi:hypothetical protein